MSVEFTPNARYPDPSVQVLDPAFARLRLFSSSVERLATGFRWAEGPVWFGDGRCLLFSDIPNDRIVRWDETTGSASTFRQPSNYSNGLVRDRQGRLVACEHLTRRITRTEYDGRITVLADRCDGKRFNSPNDIVCSRDGALWFTDPPFGIAGHWEGEQATPELPQGVYRIDPSGGLTRVIDEMAGPNGLAFSPDEKTLYVRMRETNMVSRLRGPISCSAVRCGSALETTRNALTSSPVDSTTPTAASSSIRM
jgi:gluconolactonase